MPWDRSEPAPQLREWAESHADGVTRRGRRAVVVGCGLGADAEYLASLGFDTVAFDVAPTAVRVAQERHPDSAVDTAWRTCWTCRGSGSAPSASSSRSTRCRRCPSRRVPRRSAACAAWSRREACCLWWSSARTGTSTRRRVRRSR
ncbi:MAG: methyltransferase domain-containing protein [Terrabacter sp.]|nr:methyltransferase domain-containing protein [Terrabacter sp.]